MPAVLDAKAAAESVWPGDERVSPAAALGPTYLRPELLRRRFAALRRGRKPPPAQGRDLADLPIRVLPVGDGTYEVLDGFKRLERWLEQGWEAIPVVIECHRTAFEAKRALLQANAPPRTLTPMDEARVVLSLWEEDGLSAAAIAKLLVHKPGWVDRRIALGRLAPSIVRKVDEGTIGVTLSSELSDLSHEEQEAVVAAVEQHALKVKEALALVSAYRLAKSPAERRRLLDDPLPVIRPTRSASPLGPLAKAISGRLARIGQALDDLACFRLPPDGLTASERRRLEADHRRALHQLFVTARTLEVEHPGLTPKEETDDSGRQAPGSGSTVPAGPPAGPRAGGSRPSSSGARGRATSGGLAFLPAARGSSDAGPAAADERTGRGRGRLAEDDPSSPQAHTCHPRAARADPQSPPAGPGDAPNRPQGGAQPACGAARAHRRGAHAFEPQAQGSAEAGPLPRGDPREGAGRTHDQEDPP